MRTKDSNRAIRKSGRRSRSAIISWVLIVGFLLQPVLAFLVTPIIVHDGDGLRVVMCTLEGNKLVTLDLPQSADIDESRHCPALELYQMASATQIPEPPRSPAPFPYSIELIQQTDDHHDHTLRFSSYSTRAPPQSS